MLCTKCFCKCRSTSIHRVPPLYRRVAVVFVVGITLRRQMEGSAGRIVAIAGWPRGLDRRRPPPRRVRFVWYRVRAIVPHLSTPQCTRKATGDLAGEITPQRENTKNHNTAHVTLASPIHKLCCGINVFDGSCCTYDESEPKRRMPRCATVTLTSKDAPVMTRPEGGGSGVGACSGSEDRRGRRAKMAVHLQGVEMERRGRQEATAMRYMRERDSVRIATSIHHET